MNTSALKLFAQQSRNLLRAGVEHRLTYWGFDKKGNNTASVESVGGGYTFRGKVFDDTRVPRKWNKLKAAVQQLGFDEVEERAAYTWFNRLMAMKILSKNGYETAQLDYLSLDTHTPAILERARRGQYAFLSASEKGRLQKVITDYEKEGDAFGILLTGFCHQHPLLQGIFGSIDDYTELLLPDDILTKNGFLHFLNTTDAINDDNYKQVELIGWVYQFYISEKKDEVFAGFKQNKKAEAKDIPAATQIFTPNWIVKYMVQNTLGRTWLDAHPDGELKKDWKYLVEPSQPEKAEPTSINLEALNFLDPAVGSGHILVEAFDTLYPMYLAEYYSAEEAVESILKSSLYGLDLDLRAVQLAQFALLLKAAQYSKQVLQGKLLPHIYAMPQHRNFSREEVALFLGNEHEVHVNALYKALQTMEDAHNLGSIMVLELSTEARMAVESRYHFWMNHNAKTVEEEIVKEVFPDYIPTLLILTNHFTCIAANPPYMGQKNMNAGLKNYVNKKYPLTKTDLFAVFIEQMINLTQRGSYMACITMESWMFLSSYEKMRKEILSKYTIKGLSHFGWHIIGIAFGTASMIIKKQMPSPNSKGVYSYLEIEDIDQERHVPYNFPLKTNGKYTEAQQASFDRIPGCPIAYWASDSLLSKFGLTSLEDFAVTKQGLATGDNDRFVRSWPEISKTKFNRSIKSFNESSTKNIWWVPYSKGGQSRKWYGNNDLVVYFNDGGNEIREFKDDKGNEKSRFRGYDYYFKEAITWSLTSSTSFACRFRPSGFVFDINGMSAFTRNEKDTKPLLAFLNSKIASTFLSIINPTLAFQVGDVSRIPVGSLETKPCVQITSSSIEISRTDWDSREISWDFQINPLLATTKKTLEQGFHQWMQQVSKGFFQLHANEEELNRIFIDIYGLKEELTPDIQLKDITILQEELDYNKLEELQGPYDGQFVPVHADVVMQQLISYVVGCYMGRYRLDKPGLQIAHPNATEEELAKYMYTSMASEKKTFTIDDDAIIPLMGNDASFTDDLLHRVNEFLSTVWGDDTLTANLNFLQQQLGKDLEDYLVKDFWKYHTRTYSKKPIYWLFSSKKSAFQVLVYMHRMNAYTPTKIRSKYLIPHINWLKNEVSRKEKEAASLSRAELKKLDTQRKQLVECEEYDLLLKDIADKGISFDLDDGVTKNYALFKGVVAEIK